MGLMQGFLQGLQVAQEHRRQTEQDAVRVGQLAAQQILDQQQQAETVRHNRATEDYQEAESRRRTAADEAAAKRAADSQAIAEDKAARSNWVSLLTAGLGPGPAALMSGYQIPQSAQDQLVQEAVRAGSAQPQQDVSGYIRALAPVLQGVPGFGDAMSAMVGAIPAVNVDKSPEQLRSEVMGQPLPAFQLKQDEQQRKEDATVAQNALLGARVLTEQERANLLRLQAESKPALDQAQIALRGAQTALAQRRTQDLGFKETMQKQHESFDQWYKKRQLSISQQNANANTTRAAKTGTGSAPWRQVIAEANAQRARYQVLLKPVEEDLREVRRREQQMSLEMAQTGMLLRRYHDLGYPNKIVGDKGNADVAKWQAIWDMQKQELPKLSARREQLERDQGEIRRRMQYLPDEQISGQRKGQAIGTTGTPGQDKVATPELIRQYATRYRTKDAVRAALKADGFTIPQAPGATGAVGSSSKVLTTALAQHFLRAASGSDDPATWRSAAVKAKAADMARRAGFIVP